MTQTAPPKVDPPQRARRLLRLVLLLLILLVVFLVWFRLVAVRCTLGEGEVLGAAEPLRPPEPPPPERCERPCEDEGNLIDACRWKQERLLATIDSSLAQRERVERGARLLVRAGCLHGEVVDVHADEEPTAAGWWHVRLQSASESHAHLFVRDAAGHVSHRGPCSCGPGEPPAFREYGPFREVGPCVLRRRAKR